MRRLCREYSIDEYVEFSKKMYINKKTPPLSAFTCSKNNMTDDYRSDFDFLSSKEEWKTFFFNVKNKACPYCDVEELHKVKSPVFSHIDHVLPKEKNKSLAISFHNIAPICPYCNLVKSDKVLSKSVLTDDFNDIEFKIMWANKKIARIYVYSNSLHGISYIRDLKLNEHYNTDQVKKDIQDHYNNILGLLILKKSAKNDWEWFYKYGRILKYCSKNQCNIFT